MRRDKSPLGIPLISPEGEWRVHTQLGLQACMRPRPRRSASIPPNPVLGPPIPANLGIFLGQDALHMLRCLSFAAKFQPEWNWGRFRPPNPVLLVGNPRDMEQRAFQPIPPGSFWRPNPPDLELRALSLPLYSIAKGGSILQLVLWYIFYCLGIPHN